MRKKVENFINFLKWLEILFLGIPFTWARAAWVGSHSRQQLCSPMRHQIFPKSKWHFCARRTRIRYFLRSNYEILGKVFKSFNGPLSVISTDEGKLNHRKQTSASREANRDGTRVDSMAHKALCDFIACVPRKALRAHRSHPKLSRAHKPDKIHDCRR